MSKKLKWLLFVWLSVLAAAVLMFMLRALRPGWDSGPAPHRTPAGSGIAE